ncbi:hypothetical protein B0H17DRAFT_1214872 [Mycena rosella]|uniref:NAD(P)-binding protein n=1 Tax=Mycena rosella TaxID=1033263 RepID=A0AAD7G2J5_MYCRO|nr:hypothetical protein B0H17DRAFT_1214872 [Mycena rosella]
MSDACPNASTDSRKLATAEEALAKFAADIDASSTVVPVQLDVTDAASIKNAHAFIANHLKEKDLPGLDVLINNAGTPPPPILLAYNSSKSALNSLTLQWAIQEEEKASGIRVVSICPGYNATNLNQYSGTKSPAEGCMTIVKTALEKAERSGVHFSKDGDIKW